MVKLCPLLYRIQLNRGDWVRYIGVDRKIQLDYGNQDLKILEIDLISEIAVCINKKGQRLVGVALRELQSI
jgi:hypothetical protein